MFEMYTYEVLLNDVLANAPNGIDLRQGSIFYDAVAGCVLEIAKMYTDIDQMFSYVFITTASGEYLDRKAAEYGMKRNAATAAKYYLVYEGSAPNVGARFFHSDTRLYFSVEEEENSLLLTAEEAGTMGNEIAEGDLAIPVNTINGLIASNFGVAYAYGTDTETDEHFRNRVLEKIAGPAENGNRQHYKTWCESVEGVGQARIFPLWNGENTVKGVLISPLGLPCSDSVVKAVQEYVDPADKGMTTEIDGVIYTVGDGLGNGVANIGAHFTAAAAVSYGITVACTITLVSGKSIADVQKEAEEALEEFFQALALSGNEESETTVYYAAVGAILIGLDSVLDYQNLTVNGGTENQTLGADGVPVLEGVIIDVDVSSLLAV